MTGNITGLHVNNIPWQGRNVKDGKYIMIIYDDKKIAIDPRIYRAILNIPNAQQIEILDKTEIGIGIAYIAYLSSTSFAGMCLILVIHKTELDLFTSSFPKPMQMQSLKRHIPLLEYSYNLDTKDDDLIALVMKVPLLEKDKSLKLSEFFSQELIPFHEISLRVDAFIKVWENWNSHKDLTRRVRHLTPLDSLKHCSISLEHLPDKILDIDADTSIINLNGWRSLPNPLAYIKNKDLWESFNSFPIPLGRINGAVSTEMLLVRNDIGSDDFVLLDWRSWKEDGFCPLIDFATLELDILIRSMPLIDSDFRGEWSFLLGNIFSSIYPNSPRQGIHAPLAWNLIAPIRKSVHNLIEEGSIQGIDFSFSYWIASISAGLRMLINSQQPIDKRIIGLLFASYGLDKILGNSRKSAHSILLNLNDISNLPARGKYLPFDKGFALLMGVGDYDLPLRPIPAAAQDAKLLNNILINVGYSQNNINCLVNNEASLPSVRDKMSEIKSVYTKHLDDTIIIFFSGHGAYINGEYYFLTHGADLENINETALSVKEISEWLENLKANRRLIIFDCCHSGEALQDTIVNLPDIKIDQIAGGGSIVMVSSDAKQKSYILPGSPNSVFTTCLIEALSGNAYNPLLETITAFDIFNYVSENVRQRAAKSGWRQTPRLGANINRCFPIAYPQNKRLPIV